MSEKMSENTVAKIALFQQQFRDIRRRAAAEKMTIEADWTEKCDIQSLAALSTTIFALLNKHNVNAHDKRFGDSLYDDSNATFWQKSEEVYVQTYYCNRLFYFVVTPITPSWLSRLKNLFGYSSPLFSLEIHFLCVSKDGNCLSTVGQKN